MYFAIAGKNPILSEKELSLVWEILHKEGNIFFFDTKNYSKCKNLAGFVKIGKVVPLEEFIKMDKKLLWTNIRLKPSDKEKYNFKRYKHILLSKSDLEVKTKGVEAIFFKTFKDKVGIVDFYQNIAFYEAVDFQKPVRSMGIWMMPAKLTHLMLNFATNLDYGKIVYDPFVGLWTTIFVANYFENKSIGSDLNITPSKQNLKWFQTTSFYKPNYKIFLFKQDITKDFSTKLVNYANVVVSEWYLWPTVGKFLNLKEAENLSRSFENVYLEWIKNLIKLENLEKIVITFPVYRLKNWEFYYFERLYQQISNLVKLELLPEVYIRKNQKVWRQIGILYVK